MREFREEERASLSEAGEAAPPLQGVVHSFTGSLEEALALIDLGGYLCLHEDHVSVLRKAPSYAEDQVSVLRKAPSYAGP